MRIHGTLLVLAASVLGTYPTAAVAQTPNVDTVMNQVRAAYVQADFAALEGLLAETVLFDGDTQFIPEHFVRGTGIELPRELLVSSYDRFAVRVGRERLVEGLNALAWQQLQADRDSAPHSSVRTGDHVMYAHFGGVEPPEIQDELVMFVFREVGGEYRVVAHVADF